MMWENWQ